MALSSLTRGGTREGRRPTREGPPPARAETARCERMGERQTQGRMSPVAVLIVVHRQLSVSSRETAAQ